MALYDQVLAALSAVAPVTNLDIGDPNDKTTWRVGFSDAATDAQKVAVQAAISAFNPPPTTLYSPRTLMETLFTQSEQLAMASSPLGVLFIGFIAATPIVDITTAEFIKDITQAVAAGLLTQARATQVLAGTPAPTS